ncbi:N-acetylmuramoyl-L-alanine amidase [Smithella sp. ME-1]|nr:N-acetylmuramoyl-L-alanine amidase [Smithella sp. ME-1]
MCKENNVFKEFFYFLTILIVSLFSTYCYASTEILNIRHWAAPDHTRIVLDVNDVPAYKVKEKENLLVLNFKGASIHESVPAKVIINQPGVKEVVFHHTDDMVEIEFFLDKHQKVEVFKLKKFQDKPDRVVVDIILEQIAKEEKITEPLQSPKKKKIIVIDPGHGGEDPGAIGKKGTYEKNIVLSICREIKKAINRLPGYRAVLTRDGDYYVSFKKRLQKAKDLNASLFISVHADAARNRIAKGSSVYCLSTGAASNEAAKLLAKNENLSDILGGVTDSEGNNESNQIIMNMFQTNTINLSKIYAGILMKYLDTVNYLKYNSVQEAPFRVLKLPDIPAVLVETAFISNPDEEKLLKKSGFQKTLATAVASSVAEYLSGTAGTTKSDEETTTYYKVKKGDTLFSLARCFNTKVAVLLKLNDMKLEDPLFIDQKIIVPANKDEDNEKINIAASDKKDKSYGRKKAFRIYTVKKGDTLFLLAKDNSTTVQELLKLNNMKSTDSLLYGQKIKLPKKSGNI